MLISTKEPFVNCLEKNEFNCTTISYPQKMPISSIRIRLFQDHGYEFDKSDLKFNIWKDDYIFPTKKEALKFLMAHKDTEKIIAVLYKDYDLRKFSTKKLDGLKARYKETIDEFNSLNNVLFSAKEKKKRITCSECGSIYHTDKLNSNFCPLCKNDFRSFTETRKLNNLKQKIEVLEKQVEEEDIKKHKELKKLDKIVYWLILLNDYTR